MRARNIKPGFFKNDVLAECDPLARLLFIGLWCVADREGRLEYRPKKIKIEILPYDDCNVDDLLSQLASHGFIAIYEARGNKYIEISNFSKHQNPHIKEQASTIPAPDEHGVCTIFVPGKHQTSTEQALLIPDSPILIPDSPSLIPKEDIVEQNLDPTPSPREKIPYSEIVDHLNKAAGTSYSPATKQTRSLIQARWNEGFRLPDFQAVIGVKATEWGKDPKMRIYLRPQTLFGTKFEGYLQNAPRKPVLEQGDDWEKKRPGENALDYYYRVGRLPD